MDVELFAGPITFTSGEITTFLVIVGVFLLIVLGIAIALYKLVFLKRFSKPNAILMSMGSFLLIIFLVLYQLGFVHPN